MRSTSAKLRGPLLALLACLGSIPAAQGFGGPQGFNTVIIDPGHGGIDRGGGPGQRIPEKPYTLDTALRLQRALRARGFRTVMTRSSDVFVSLPQRVAIANSYRDAIFLSVHFNSAPRVDAHGFETYYFRPDSFGLASRLHRAQLSSANTEDRFVRRRGFYVIRNTRIPAVLCEGGFLTNPDESQRVMSATYRERWAQDIADALTVQRREGNPAYLGVAPPVTTERLVVSHSSRRRHGHLVSSRRHGHSSSSHHSHSSSTHHSSTKKKRKSTHR